MDAWISYSLLVIAAWGLAGLLQKLGTNRVSAESLLVWLTAGYILLLPWLLMQSGVARLSSQALLIGVLAGLTNGLGAWFFFASLRSGAKASVAVPLTALNPLVTVLLAVVFLSEKLTNLQWFGVFLATLAGVLIACETPERT